MKIMNSGITMVSGLKCGMLLWLLTLPFLFWAISLYKTIGILYIFLCMFHGLACSYLGTQIKNE